MFWESVGSGLAVLLHWQVYVAVLENLAIVLLPTMLLGTLLSRGEGGGAVLAGCVTPLLLAFFQCVGALVFTLTVAPIIFGRGDGAAWSFPWLFMASAPWTFLKLTFFMLITAFLATVVRLGLLVNLVLGGLALAFAASNIAATAPALDGHTVALWPGFWFMVGVLVVSAVCFAVGALLASFVAGLLERVSEGMGQFVAQPLAGVLLYIPVFIYGAWLGEKMRIAVVGG